MRNTLAAGAILGLCLFQPSVAQAQISRIELGMDAGFERATLTDSDFDSSTTITLIGIPAQWMRFGFYLRDEISIEPRLGITRVSGEDASQLQGRIPVALMYHIRPTEGGASFFFEGLGGIDFIRESSNGDSDSTVQFRVGGGAGMLAPFGDAFAFRVAGEYHRSFETDDLAGADRIILTVGFSFFIDQ